MSLKQISELTGCSIGTVSKAFSGSSEISDFTRDKIFSVAKQLGLYEKYSKNSDAPLSVALIIPEFQSEYYIKIVTGLSSALKKRGVYLITAESGFDPSSVEALFSHFAYRLKVNGIIVADNPSEIKNADKFPALMLSMSDDRPLYDVVSVSLSDALYAIVDYLFHNGHRSIAFIGEELTVSKRNAFIRAMRKKGLPVADSMIKTVSSRFENAGYEAMNEILSSSSVPTAVIAAYDYIAIGAIRAIKEHSLIVPDDISVVGMDNISAGESLSTPLTTLSVFSENDFEALADMMMKKIENKNISLKSASFSVPELIKRGSVKKIDR